MHVLKYIYPHSTILFTCHQSFSLNGISFAAACMTWELAESGCEFITSVINGADLVPTFSAASVDDLRSEVNFWIYLIEFLWLLYVQIGAFCWSLFLLW